MAHAYKGILITTTPCGRCGGSGRVHSADLVDEIQRNIGRGLLDADDLIAISKIVKGALPQS